MSDLETRLSEGLAGAAERAPHPGELTTGARDRLRRRRRTTIAVVAAALAVVAIPVGLTVVGQEAGDGGGPDQREPSTVATAPDDWRTETWRDLSVNVPPEWGFGGGTDWCANGRDLEEALQVSRPSGVVPTIACAPAFGYGAHFLEPSSGELPPGTEGVVQQYRGARYPDDAWIGYASTQQTAVWVVAADRTTARLVLDSATPVGEVDASGCATRIEIGAPSTNAEVSVCRYSSDGWLEQSELLAKDESARVREAVLAAPRVEDTGYPKCSALVAAGPAIVLTGGDLQVRVVLEGRCHGVDDGVDEAGPRRLTPDVLYWALSPGWSGSLSMLTYDAEPLQLRTQ